MEDVSREELKRLKRLAAIRAKEDEFERKRKAEEESKRRQLEDMKADFEAKEKERVEERLRFLEKQAAARAQRKARIETLNKKREEKINQKQADWLQRANNEIFDIIKEQEVEQIRLQEALDLAREHKRDLEEADRHVKQQEKARWQELEYKREERQQEREAQRALRVIYEVDKLKTEASEELESFILNPEPVPLRQVLAGRMRPVPTVTELLASYKDQKEELQELMEQDIPTRALLRNQSLFQYVRDIQLKAEAVRVQPPQPQMVDLAAVETVHLTARNEVHHQECKTEVEVSAQCDLPSRTTARGDINR
eukprot:CAMPEP_0206590414 /NCGR_PEP_ID=MMETSP0325_2-20121206/39610_1 /ASSEMBLY_ACC=CAM_ASM_000347 /TAXON_ID=2866 /ORGANISM="Crypthecodinium cohnii, Strain Seligo" /LENGTH=310 /DNA_ID=CAMNT_0054099371 /DNA_START=309 /DNA_END=1239 /DNA_ORIENTATION=+